MDEVLVAAQGVKKVFRTGDIAVEALRGIDLEIGSGEFMAIVGPSGSGKTTLLNLIGALDVPTSGHIAVFGRELGPLSRSERAELRLRSLGFVFQAYNLVPVLTARENVEFVLELQGMDPKKRRARAEETLAELGLGELADRRPSQMSGGQQQRVAVARAVASRPGLVLADEPTANLDSDNAQALLQMMRRLRDEMGMTFVFSTHDPLVVSYASRVVTLRDGEVLSDERKVHAADAGGSLGGAARVWHQLVVECGREPLLGAGYRAEVDCAFVARTRRAVAVPQALERRCAGEGAAGAARPSCDGSACALGL